MFSARRASRGCIEASHPTSCEFFQLSALVMSSMRPARNSSGPAESLAPSSQHAHLVIFPTAAVSFGYFPLYPEGAISVSCSWRFFCFLLWSNVMELFLIRRQDVVNLLGDSNLFCQHLLYFRDYPCASLQLSLMRIDASSYFQLTVNCLLFPSVVCGRN